ncbi:nrm1-like protein [Apiospora phragmitis]|uniref:Nrm1-like protein n=1 Tax=Apiospora phragmitis TaxID=2905665 RepID=A0ABR1VDP3_9PEZI
MSSPLKKQPEAVADKVLKRVEVSKVSEQQQHLLQFYYPSPPPRWVTKPNDETRGLQIARRLQGRLALAHFKTKHGWEDLTLDTLEPKLDEERRKRTYDGDVLSDSSSSTSELPYPTRTLMSSPLKAPLFSDAIGSSNGSTGHRKRTYMASFDMDMALSSPAKRYRSSPTAHKSFHVGQNNWKSHRQLIQSSPIKPRRQQHFTTSTGPNVSFFQGARRISVDLASPNFAAPPRMTRRTSSRLTPSSSNLTIRHRRERRLCATDLSMAEIRIGTRRTITKAARRNGTTVYTSPKKDLALPSSMMTTPGGGNLFPATPGQPFDFADFVNITPSPAQKPWKTPIGGISSAKTPVSITRRRLTFDEPLVHGLP